MQGQLLHQVCHRELSRNTNINDIWKKKKKGRIQHLATCGEPLCMSPRGSVNGMCRIGKVLAYVELVQFVILKAKFCRMNYMQSRFVTGICNSETGSMTSMFQQLNTLKQGQKDSKLILLYKGLK